MEDKSWGFYNSGNFLHNCYNNDMEEELITSISSNQKSENTESPCACFRCTWMADELCVQSEEVTDTENTSESVTQAENIQFKDDALSEQIYMGNMSNGDYDADSDTLAGLGSFLSRPVRIINFIWQESTFYQQTYSPWDLFFNDVHIKKKIDNYARIQCKLHLKFILNASPFYYGSLRACYFPLGDERSDYVNVADQVPFSQTPGLYLEPQNMSSAEMVLPFLWPKNWLDLTTNFEFSAMGQLQILQYANLRSANGVAGAGVNVSVYAWAEEVQLMGPTTKLALQSDEYETSSGTISGPSTAAANIAAKLVNVPVIGPFANATSIGARAISSIARLFGYSNPPIIDDVHGFQPKTFHAFANSETRMPIDKLTLDPKNEVTISPTVAGVDEDDPLAFSNLLTRESFILGTLWSGSQAADTLLWSALVAPGYLINSGSVYTCPPVSHFSEMYRYWRGSLIYKFRFIKTKYHTGRLLISWDPTGSNVTTADNETTTLTRIVDLQLEDEVEFIVPYKATTPYLSTNRSTSILSNGAAPVYTYDSSYHNGSITIRVQNVLTGPAASPQIDILGYVRAGDDFTFAAPTEIALSWTISDPTGVIQSSEVENKIAIDNKQHSVDAQISSITTGETHASIRPLLHRSSLSCIQYIGSPTTVSAAGFLSTVNGYWRYPLGTGRNAYAYNFATISAAPVPYAFNTNHPIDWTINCFVGVRGSTNLHFNLLSTTTAPIPEVTASRLYETPLVAPSSGNRNGKQEYASALLLGEVPRLAIRNIPGPFTARGQEGMSLTNYATQAALSVNVPQYSNSRFTQAFKTVRNRDPSTELQIFDEVVFRTRFFNSITTFAATAAWPQVAVYYAAGVDFQPIFFLCTPRVFQNTYPPGA